MSQEKLLEMDLNKVAEILKIVEKKFGNKFIAEFEISFKEQNESSEGRIHNLRIKEIAPPSS
jgi:hypothetical protein